jgi:hypothetical protein
LNHETSKTTALTASFKQSTSIAGDQLGKPASCSRGAHTPLLQSQVPQIHGHLQKFPTDTSTDREGTPTSTPPRTRRKNIGIAPVQAYTPAASMPWATLTARVDGSPQTGEQKRREIDPARAARGAGDGWMDWGGQGREAAAYLRLWTARGDGGFNLERALLRRPGLWLWRVRVRGGVLRRVVDRFE